MRWLLLPVAIVLCGCLIAAAQAPTYTPLGELPARGAASGVLRAAANGCSTPPTLAEIQDQHFEGSESTYSAAYAAQLGIKFIGVDGNFALDDLVLVSDLVRGKECLATDGHTRLLYGQAMRAIVRTSKLDVKTSVTLAIIAASATISRKENFVKMQSMGLPSKVQALMLDAENLASSGLTVENYGKFQDKITEAKKEALQPAGSVVLIGLIEDVKDNDLIASVTRAFALAYLSEGHPCSDAIRDYHRTDQQKIIQTTYDAVAKGCARPSDAARQKARELLDGVEVTLR